MLGSSLTAALVALGQVVSAADSSSLNLLSPTGQDSTVSLNEQFSISWTPDDSNEPVCVSIFSEAHVMLLGECLHPWESNSTLFTFPSYAKEGIYHLEVSQGSTAIDVDLYAESKSN